MKRLQGHYRWLKNPPEKEPQLEDFGGKLEQDRKGRQIRVFPHLDAERRYKAACREWKQYQVWLRERNPARAKLEALYHYDTKHAGNLVRMIIQGKELLEKGTFNPKLIPETKELILHVLHGGWEYEELIAWAEARDGLLKEMPTSLPKKPKFRCIEALLMELNEGSLTRYTMLP